MRRSHEPVWHRRLVAVLAACCFLKSPAPVAQGVVNPFEDARTRGLAPEEVPPRPLRPVADSRFAEAWRAPLGSPLAGPLRGLGARVITTLESGTLLALSVEDGRELWRREAGGRPAGAPVVSGDALVQVLEDGSTAALDADTGAVRWSLELNEPVAAPPAGTLEEVFVPLRSSQLVTLHHSGRELWRVPLGAPASVAPAACRGSVMVGTEGGTVEAFERRTGRPLWVAQTGAAVISEILCHRGGIYFGTSDKRLWGLKPSGRKNWRFPAGAQCTARPFGFEDRIYFPSFDNYLYVLKARSGNLVLRVKMSHRLSDEVEPGQDRIYLSPYTSGRLAALSLPDLIQAGEYPLDLEGDWFTTPPLRLGGRLLIGYGRHEGRVLALNETLEAPEREPEPAAP